MTLVSEAEPQTHEFDPMVDEVEIVVCSGLYQAEPSLSQPRYVSALRELIETGRRVEPNSELARIGRLPEVIVGGLGPGTDEALVARHDLAVSNSMKASNVMLEQIKAEHALVKLEKRQRFRENHPVLGHLAMMASNIRHRRSNEHA